MHSNGLLFSLGCVRPEEGYAYFFTKRSMVFGLFRFTFGNDCKPKSATNNSREKAELALLDKELKQLTDEFVALHRRFLETRDEEKDELDSVELERILKEDEKLKNARQKLKQAARIASNSEVLTKLKQVEYKIESNAAWKDSPDRSWVAFRQFPGVLDNQNKTNDIIGKLAIINGVVPSKPVRGLKGGFISIWGC